MPEDWEKFWNKESIITKIIDFARENYFSKVPIYYLGNVKGKSILEPGCGTSQTLVKIAKLAKKVTATDISDNALAISRMNFKKNKIPQEKYIVAKDDLKNMKFRSGSFDITFNCSVLEHFDDDKINSRPLEEMIRVTKKKGRIIFLVPSKYSFFYLYYLLTRLRWFRKLYPWEEHCRYYTFGMLRNQLERLGVRYRIKLSWRSFLIFLVAEIEK